jgi:hypothetical protein
MPGNGNAPSLMRTLYISLYPRFKCKKAAHLPMRHLCNRVCFKPYLLASTIGKLEANCKLTIKFRRRSI